MSANRKLAQRQAEEARQTALEAEQAAAVPVFAGLTPEQAGQQAARDAEQARQVPGPALWALALILGGVLLAALPWLLVQSALRLPLLGLGIVLAALGAGLLVRSLRRRQEARQLQGELLARYEAASPEGILARAASYRERQGAAEQAAQKCQAAEASLSELTRQQEERKTRLLDLAHTFAPDVTDTFGISAAISRSLGLEEQLSTSADIRGDGESIGDIGGERVGHVQPPGF